MMPGGCRTVCSQACHALCVASGLGIRVQGLNPSPPCPCTSNGALPPRISWCSPQATCLVCTPLAQRGAVRERPHFRPGQLRAWEALSISSSLLVKSWALDKHQAAQHPLLPDPG